jgi:hypothetical protein
MEIFDNSVNSDYELATEIAKNKNNFLALTLLLFPWREKGTELENVELERWQSEFLQQISVELKRNNFTGDKPVKPVRFTRTSGHGIGKSALMSILAVCIMSTRPYCRGTVTANTFTQLETKTWPEMRKWFALSLNGDWFKIMSTIIQHKGALAKNRDDWHLSMQNSKKENAEAFAGQHARQSTSFFLFDESSSLDELIWQTALGGLTDGEPMLFAFGNPTRNKGMFYEINFGKYRAQWNHARIDSREVSFSNKEEIEEWRQTYGEDHDVFRVRARGLYPNTESNQFISPKLVAAAVKRRLTPDSYSHLPRILGVDPAGHGSDFHVIVLRQGYKAWVIKKIKHLTYETHSLAHLVAQCEDKYGTTATFIDAHGVGIGTIDTLRSLGRKPIMVISNSQPLNSIKFKSKDKRSEMWSDMRDWLSFADIPEDDDLMTELSVFDEIPDHQFTIVESKKDALRRGESSPNEADALAYTFYMPVKFPNIYINNQVINPNPGYYEEVIRQEYTYGESDYFPNRER